MIFVILMLLLLLFCSFYVIYNLYSKYDKLENIAQDNVEFIMSIRARVLSQESYLKQLDRQGAFASDDEVGIFFKELKKIITDISLYLDITEDNDDGDTDELVIQGKIERF